jgi:hypothetical protein
LSRETAAQAGPEEIIAGAGRVFRRLRGSLALWFGTEGFDALLGRAMDRANSACPALGNVGDPAPGASLLDALAERARSQPPAEVAEAAVAVLAAFITLLGRLIGSDLAERLIEQSWPHEARAPTSRGSYSE